MSPRQRVVVAGGIGSGKSTVIGVLSELGWSVLKADLVGHEVLNDPDVVDCRGRSVADGRGRWESQPVRAGRQTCFANAEELAALEEITHPRIVGRIDKWIEVRRWSRSPSRSPCSKSFGPAGDPLADRSRPSERAQGKGTASGE